MATIHLYQPGTISCLCFICRVHFLFLSPVISDVSHSFLDGGAQPVLCLESLFQRNAYGHFPVTNSAKQGAGPVCAVHKAVTMGPLISQPELFCLFATYTTRMPVFGCTYLSAQGVLTTGLMSHERVAICASFANYAGKWSSRRPDSIDVNQH